MVVACREGGGGGGAGQGAAGWRAAAPSPCLVGSGQGGQAGRGGGV